MRGPVRRAPSFAEAPLLYSLIRMGSPAAAAARSGSAAPASAAGALAPVPASATKLEERALARRRLASAAAWWASTSLESVLSHMARSSLLHAHSSSVRPLRSAGALSGAGAGGGWGWGRWGGSHTGWHGWL